MNKEIGNIIVEWYQKNGRDLPWRKDKNPYHILVSEIMLQQTKIEAVLGYYERFLLKLPTIEELANVSEDELLKLWEGLGYYNRARNLKRAATIIVSEFGGVFPEEYEMLLSLPGIGPYTAAAISSICFQKRQVTVDGNVLRVYSRVMNCFDNITDDKTRKKVEADLLEIIPYQTGDFNEGLMELGEMVCIANGKPRCEICPLQQHCQAFSKNTVDSLPIRIKKVKQKEEVVTVFLLKYQDKFAVCQRTDKTMLKNMWEFPNVENEMEQEDIINYVGDCSFDVKKTFTNRHVFSHKIWNMKGYLIEISQSLGIYTWVSLEEIEQKYALSKAFHPFIKELKEYYGFKC